MSEGIQPPWHSTWHGEYNQPSLRTHLTRSHCSFFPFSHSLRTITFLDLFIFIWTTDLQKERQRSFFLQLTPQMAATLSRSGDRNQPWRTKHGSPTGNSLQENITSHECQIVFSKKKKNKWEKKVVILHFLNCSIWKIKTWKQTRFSRRPLNTRYLHDTL